MRRQRIGRLWRWLVLALALWQLFGTAQAVRRDTAGVGLRFAQPLETAQVEAACSAALESGLTVSFWGELQGEAKTAAGRSASAVGVFCDGRPDQCWPAVYRSGTAPGTADSTACAVSEGLARALWGSTQVVGNVLHWQGKTYTVCGVFRDRENRLLYLGQGDFTALELDGVDRDNPAEAALQYRNLAGLPTPAASLMGPMLDWGIAVGCWLPLLLPAGWLALWGLRWLGHRRRGEILLFAVALLLALALPGVLEGLPGWLIPARWSDFGFWTDLAGQAGEGIQTLLSLPPTGRDIALRRNLAAYLFWLVVSCGVALGLMGKTGPPPT